MPSRKPRTPQDDARAQCRHCRRKIRWSAHQKKWFHLHNFMTFCFGGAFKEMKKGRVESPRALPK